MSCSPRGRATAAEIQANLPDAPSYSAVRALLRILETKGHVRHEQDGPRYVYVPVVALDSAKRSALAHLVRTFFDGSTEEAVAALLDGESTRLSNVEECGDGFLGGTVEERARRWRADRWPL